MSDTNKITIFRTDPTALLLNRQLLISLSVNAITKLFKKTTQEQTNKKNY